MPSRTEFEVPRVERRAARGRGSGSGTPPTARISRGFTAVPLATRAVITASCSGEARVKPWPMP